MNQQYSSKNRAIPKELNFIWETGKNQQFVDRAYFSWEKTNESFKKAGNNAKLEFKTAPDNSNFEIFLNNEPLKPTVSEFLKRRWNTGILIVIIDLKLKRKMLLLLLSLQSVSPSNFY